MQALAAEQDVSVILEGLRNHDDLMTIVQKIHPNSASASEASPSASTSDSMQSSTEGSSAPSTQSTAPMIGNEKRHDESGYSKLQDLNPIREISTRAQRQKACRWHTILADDLLVKQLVSIYWIWIHPVHPILDMQDFILDYDKGVGEHCSTFLVHAMCLAACDLLSPSWEHIPGQDTDVVALQQHLMVRAQADAQAALAEGSDASTTTAQALAIMSVVKTLLGEGDSSRVEDAALEPHSAVLRLRRTEAEAPF
ncbi:hypothetical protein MMC19_000440 [Ptychographa xylographoides]|nr:hypothetical protein [Ptychographa xylographoides]